MEAFAAQLEALTPRQDGASDFDPAPEEVSARETDIAVEAASWESGLKSGTPSVAHSLNSDRSDVRRSQNLAGQQANVTFLQNAWENVNVKGLITVDLSALYSLLSNITIKIQGLEVGLDAAHDRLEKQQTESKKLSSVLSQALENLRFEMENKVDKVDLGAKLAGLQDLLVAKVDKEEFEEELMSVVHFSDLTTILQTSTNKASKLRVHNAENQKKRDDPDASPANRPSKPEGVDNAALKEDEYHVTIESIWKTYATCRATLDGLRAQVTNMFQEVAFKDERGLLGLEDEAFKLMDDIRVNELRTYKLEGKHLSNLEGLDKHATTAERLREESLDVEGTVLLFERRVKDFQKDLQRKTAKRGPTTEQPSKKEVVASAKSALNKQMAGLMTADQVRDLVKKETRLQAANAKEIEKQLLLIAQSMQTLKVTTVAEAKNHRGPSAEEAARLDSLVLQVDDIASLSARTHDQLKELATDKASVRFVHDVLEDIKEATNTRFKEAEKLMNIVVNAEEERLKEEYEEDKAYSTLEGGDVEDEDEGEDEKGMGSQKVSFQNRRESMSEGSEGEERTTSGSGTRRQSESMSKQEKFLQIMAKSGKGAGTMRAKKVNDQIVRLAEEMLSINETKAEEEALEMLREDMQNSFKKVQDKLDQKVDLPVFEELQNEFRMNLRDLRTVVRQKVGDDTVEDLNRQLGRKADLKDVTSTMRMALNSSEQALNASENYIGRMDDMNNEIYGRVQGIEHGLGNVLHQVNPGEQLERSWENARLGKAGPVVNLMQGKSGYEMYQNIPSTVASGHVRPELSSPKQMIRPGGYTQSIQKNSLLFTPTYPGSDVQGRSTVLVSRGDPNQHPARYKGRDSGLSGAMTSTPQQNAEDSKQMAVERFMNTRLEDAQKQRKPAATPSPSREQVLRVIQQTEWNDSPIGGPDRATTAVPEKARPKAEDRQYVKVAMVKPTTAVPFPKGHKRSITSDPSIPPQ